MTYAQVYVIFICLRVGFEHPIVAELHNRGFDEARIRTEARFDYLQSYKTLYFVSIYLVLKPTYFTILLSYALIEKETIVVLCYCNLHD